MSNYQRKYRKGGKITSLDELANQEFVYFCDSITHCGWFKSWQFRSAQRYIDCGCLFYAERVDADDSLPEQEEAK